MRKNMAIAHPPLLGRSACGMDELTVGVVGTPGGLTLLTNAVHQELLAPSPGDPQGRIPDSDVAQQQGGGGGCTPSLIRHSAKIST